jgi:hypothetical protein
MNDIIKEIKGIESPELKDFINTDIYPTIEVPSSLTDLFLLDTIDEAYRNKHFDYYDYKGIGVPRATHILNQCINKEFLIAWAAKIGYKQYYYEKDKATTIGSRTHELIEDFLMTGKFNDKIFYKVAPSIKKNVSIAFNNFKEWMNTLANKGYFLSDIIAMEKQITCPYFGGTVDCICRINGRVYIVDFKTSKKISPEYLLQVCAYMWICNSGYVENMPRIDGVGIIRVDKESRHKFEDVFLNYEIPWQAEIINRYISDFGVLLQSYYTLISMEKEFPKIKKSVKNTFDVLDGKG